MKKQRLTEPTQPLPKLKITKEINALLLMALQEDIGAGDVTSNAVIPPRMAGEGLIFSKQGGVLCGIDVARRVLQLVDKKVEMEVLAEDGAVLKPWMEIAKLRGSLRSMLSAERLMLNFLQRLSGIATQTRHFVDALRAAGSAIEVADTRKTTPLWRTLERHAVRVGGGINHRFALCDMYLIKNNHVDAVGGMREALRRVHAANRGAKLKIAVEARNLREVEDIVAIGADLILLDNMSPVAIRKAANLVAGRIPTEVTGKVSVHQVPVLARLPVDRVSVGALTHSSPALDISLHLKNL